MSSFSRTTAMSALLGAAFLASPVAAMAADSVPPAPAAAVSTGTEAPRETVEQRITSLHASLNITPGEEVYWSGVSKAMRDSAGVMEKLAASKAAKASANMTALDDLRMYETFAQAHADGLKKLTSSFARLYRSMPDAQKKVADEVFQNAGHGKSMSHG